MGEAAAPCLVRARRMMLVSMVAKMADTSIILVLAILRSTRPDRLVRKQDQQHDEQPATHWRKF